MKLAFVSLFFCLFFIFLHGPFLESDPLIEKGNFSRDALTDEGLNTAQLANFVKTSSFGMDENNNLIKSPAFNALLLPVSYFTDNSLFFSRLCMLLFSGSLLFLLFRKLKLDLVECFIFFALLCNFYIFQYAGFTMAESLGSFLMPLSILAFAAYFRDFQRRYLFWGSFCLFFIFLLKVQFLYLYCLPAFVIFLIFRLGKESWKKDTLFLIGINFSFFLLYFLLWILPNMTLVNLVLEQEVSGRIMHPRFWTSQAFDQFFSYMFDLKNGPLLILFLAAVACFLFFSRKLEKDKLYYISLFSLLWCLVECHKFFIWYLPPRYLLSTLIAFSFFVFIQAIIVIRNRPNMYFKGLLISFFVGVLAANSFFYFHALEKRTFSIKAENTWFRKHVKQGDVVAGVWGCILAKESAAKTIPVWNGFFNDKKLIEKYDPKIIVTENNEAESGGAFSGNGLDLNAMAKQKHAIRLGKYKITAYVLK